MQTNSKRWIKRVLLGGLAAGALVAGVSVYLLHRPPAVWTEAQEMLDQSSESERAELAKGVMRRLADASAFGSDAGFALRGSNPNEVGNGLDPRELQRLANQNIDETFEIKLTNEELLAVASDWADTWVAQRGFEMPDQMTQPIVMVRKGDLMLAFELKVGSWRQVFSGKVTMRFDPDGMAHGRVRQLTAGSLPIPITSVGDWLAKQLPASEAKLAEKIGRWIAELDDFAFRPVLELEHRRRARVIAMQVSDESLTMTMRVQDHQTYKKHNTLMQTGAVAVTDSLNTAALDGSAFADVPTTTE